MINLNDYQELLKWKEKGRGIPLILLGQRFIGKTTLIKNFGRKEFDQIIYINFEEMKDIKELFDGTLSLEEMLKKTANLLGFFEVNSENTLFVLDEIQSFPNIVSLVKYVYEQIPPFYLIIASSDPGLFLNIDVTKFINKIKIYEIKPYSFEEFLKITNVNLFENYLKITPNNNLDKIIHEQLINEFKNYLIIGGFPESVYTWKTTKKLNKVAYVQNNLISQIRNTFFQFGSKYNMEKLMIIFENIPLQLENKNKKFIFNNLKTGARAREYNDALNWLVNSQVINRLNLALFDKENNNLSVEQKSFRLYLNDVGIFKHLSNIQNDQIIINRDYKNKKALLEHFVYQQIQKLFSNIHYFSFNRFFIDFVIEYNGMIIPIDVKTSDLTNKTSLKNYVKNFQPQIAIRYSFNYLKKEKNIINIPFYLIGKTKEIIDFFLKG